MAGGACAQSVVREKIDFPRTQNNILAESHDLSTYGKSELPRCNSNSGQYVWDKCLGSEGGYVGEFRNNKREGLGVFTAKEGWKYVGEFST